MLKITLTYLNGYKEIFRSPVAARKGERWFFNRFGSQNIFYDYSVHAANLISIDVEEV